MKQDDAGDPGRNTFLIVTGVPTDSPRDETRFGFSPNPKAPWLPFAAEADHYSAWGGLDSRSVRVPLRDADTHFQNSRAR